jgi:MOSC domain-containing protein YiiM
MDIWLMEWRVPEVGIGGRLPTIPAYHVDMSCIRSINTSPGGIPKHPNPSATLSVLGLDGDGHDHEKHRTPIQALSLLDLEVLEAIADESGIPLPPGALGENLTVEGVGVQLLAAGDRLIIEGGVELQVTRVRPPCYVLDHLSPDFKKTLWNRVGMYASVITPGTLAVGQTITVDRCGTGARPLVRQPKEGCVDGGDFARRILRELPSHPASNGASS